MPTQLRFLLPLTLLALWLLSGQKILSILNPEKQHQRQLGKSNQPENGGSSPAWMHLRDKLDADEL